MTEREAKRIFLKSDCSYFVMCQNYYADYIEYRRLELPKEKEDEWKREKIQLLRSEVYKKRSSYAFYRFCEVASTFRDYENLRIVLGALKWFELSMRDWERVSMAEIILGRKALKVRSGLIFWAHDVGQRAIAILLMDLALEYLNIQNVSNVNLERKLKEKRRLCKRIIKELKLDFSNRYLKKYYDF